MSPARLSLSYRLRDASPAKGVRSQSPKPLSASASRNSASRSLNAGLDPLTPIIGCRNCNAVACDTRVKGEHYRILGDTIAHSFRPFDQTDGISEGRVEAKLNNLIRVTKAVQIRVPNLDRTGGIGLNKGICR